MEDVVMEGWIPKMLWWRDGRRCAGGKEDVGAGLEEGRCCGGGREDGVMEEGRRCDGGGKMR
jgi:hypothetical protein